MKISVITLQNVSNYGSVLQAYATQKYFTDRGCEVEFVDYWRQNMLDGNIARDLVENQNLKLKKIWGKNTLLRSAAAYLLEKKIAMRAKPFRRFTKKYLTMTATRYTSLAQLQSDPPDADCYCVGSDQVWNSDWNGGLDQAFYLRYGPESVKRISFSSSFGKEHLPDEEEKQVRDMLKRFSVVTVRENTAAELLSRNGIDAQCILDPTLLITKAQWEPILNYEIQKKGRYILVYQLNENPLFDQAVAEAARLLACKVLRIEYHKSDKLGEHIVLPDVQDWVSYFYYASYVITDSFHATAFSINFEKNFVDILPEKFGTRILSILEKTGLQDRRIVGADQADRLDAPIDYPHVAELLRQERQNANYILSETGD